MQSDPEPAIPFNKPPLIGTEESFVRDAFKRCHVSGGGHYSGLCQQLLQQETGAHRVLLTTSCTHALEMAALLLNLETGDEVIVPSFTFVSTANAFATHGARLSFCDVRPDTLNLDEARLDGLITNRTRAIVVVHYAGVGCEMDTINEIAAKRGLPVIEDNAHGLFAKYRDRQLGSFGCLATLSFHETKNFSCGEGGALLINDPAFVERAEIIREKGTDRSRFFRGEVDRYTWVDVGSSYLPSDVLAAILYAQLQARDKIRDVRRRIWNTYRHELAQWEQRSGSRGPVVPPHCEPSHHSYFLIMPTAAAQAGLIAHLRHRGIGGVFHYQPLHLSTMGRRLRAAPCDCPTTEDLSARLVRLPFYYDLAPQEQTRVIAAVRAFSC